MRKPHVARNILLARIKLAFSRKRKVSSMTQKRGSGIEFKCLLCRKIRICLLFRVSHCLPPFRYVPASVTSLDNYPPAHTRARARRAVQKTMRYSAARDDNDYSDKFARASTASACTRGLENVGRERGKGGTSALPTASGMECSNI